MTVVAESEIERRPVSEVRKAFESIPLGEETERLQGLSNALMLARKRHKALLELEPEVVKHMDQFREGKISGYATDLLANAGYGPEFLQLAAKGQSGLRLALQKIKADAEAIQDAATQHWNDKTMPLYYAHVTKALLNAERKRTPENLLNAVAAYNRFMRLSKSTIVGLEDEPKRADFFFRYLDLLGYSTHVHPPQVSDDEVWHMAHTPQGFQGNSRELVTSIFNHQNEVEFARKSLGPLTGIEQKFLNARVLDILSRKRVQPPAAKMIAAFAKFAKQKDVRIADQIKALEKLLDVASLSEDERKALEFLHYTYGSKLAQSEKKR